MGRPGASLTAGINDSVCQRFPFEKGKAVEATHTTAQPGRRNTFFLKLTCGKAFPGLV